MTDNSAEREAEEIFKAAANKIQAEQCPQGEGCGVHFRVDEAISYPQDEDARYITYVGDHVVITEDNHELTSPNFLISALMGRVGPEDIPNRWATEIFWVGEGAIYDLTMQPDEVRLNALRYSTTHDVWEEVEAQHLSVVSMLEAGLIDVSKPIKMGD